MRIRKYLDLLIVGTLAVFTLCVTWFRVRGIEAYETMPPWFLPIGVLIVLVLPGYSIVVSFLPPLNGSLTMLLTLGISMGVSIIGGLLLNMRPGGLGVTSWAIWFCSVTLFACSIGFLRRWLHPTEAPNWNLEFFLRPSSLVIFPVTILIVVIAIYANWFAAQQSQSRFTQLWAIPVSTKPPYSLEIGIRNQEREAKKYDLYIESLGKKINSQSEIELGPGQEWTTMINFANIPRGAISVYVYLSEAPDKIYRWVKIAPEAFGRAAPDQGMP